MNNWDPPDPGRDIYEYREGVPQRLVTAVRVTTHLFVLAVLWGTIFLTAYWIWKVLT